jgi:hypothetical protein
MSNVPDQPKHLLTVEPHNAPTAAIAALLVIPTGRRPSISTECTEDSPAAADDADDSDIPAPTDTGVELSDVCPYPRRNKGRYRLADFRFIRAVSTGSFGRVYLGESLVYVPAVCERACIRRMMLSTSRPASHGPLTCPPRHSAE